MAAIPLRTKDGSVKAYALVDEEDLPLVEGASWHASRDGYAMGWCPVDKRMVRMHRQLLGLGKGDPRQADHINGDRLDNRRENLRIVTLAQNRQNVHGYSHPWTEKGSKYRGVSWSKQAGMWRADGTTKGKQYFLGNYGNEAEAAEVAAAFRREHMPFAVEERQALNGG